MPAWKMLLVMLVGALGCDAALAQVDFPTRPPPGIELELPRPAGPATAWAASPDGSILFTSHADRTVRIWNFLDGSVRSVLTPAPVVRLQPLGGLPGALVLTRAGEVLFVYADRRRAERLRRGVIAISTSPQGEYAALVFPDKVQVLRVHSGGGFDLVREIAVSAISAAMSGDGLELVVGTAAGEIIRYLPPPNRPEVTRLTAPAAELAFDQGDYWLIARQKDGALVAIPRGDPQQTSPRLLGRDIENFDVRRRSVSGAGEPLVIATDQARRVRVWREHEGGIDEGTPLGAHARGAVFDPWGDSRIERAFLFEEAVGSIALHALSRPDAAAQPLATLYPTDRSGWAAIDARKRTDGDALTMAEISRAVSLSLQNRTPYPVDRLHGGCPTGDLLSELRELGVPGPGSDSCRPRARMPRPQIRIEPPRKTAGAVGDMFEVAFAVTWPAGERPGADAVPTVIHQGRRIVRPVQSIPCGGDADEVQTSCWKGLFRPLPGARNTLYVQVERGGKYYPSDRIDFSAPARRGPPRAPRLVIVTVAVSAYGGGGVGSSCGEKLLCDLASAVKDVSSLSGEVRSALASSGIRTVEVTPIADGDVTPQAFLKTMASLDTYPEDIVWVIMSGHGFYSDRARGGNGEFYFLLPGTQRDVADYLRTSAGTPQLTAAVIAEGFSMLDARFAALTIDACYAGGARESTEMGLRKRFGEVGGPLGLEMFLAAAPWQEAPDGNADTPSPAMAALQSTLLASVTSREALSMRELFERASRELARHDQELLARMKATPGWQVTTQRDYRHRVSLGSDMTLLAALDTAGKRSRAKR